MALPNAIDVRDIEEKDLRLRGGTVFSTRSTGKRLSGVIPKITINGHTDDAPFIGGGGEGSVFAFADKSGDLKAVKVSVTNNGTGSWFQAPTEKPWGAPGTATEGIAPPKFAAVWEKQVAAEIDGLSGIRRDQPVLVGEIHTGTLSDEISHGRSFSDERVAQVTTCVILPLLESGLVHRDIKPDNIYITTKGGVRLGDWGLAARDGELVGAGCTEIYASDRQLDHLDRAIAARKGQNTDIPADPHWDTYAMGMVMVEMTTGQTARRDLSGIANPDAQRIVERSWRHDHGVRSTGSAYLDIVVASACRPNGKGSTPLDMLIDVYPLLPEKDRIGPDSLIPNDVRRSMAERIVERGRDWQDKSWKKAEFERLNPGQRYTGDAPLPQTTTLSAACVMLADARKLNDQYIEKLTEHSVDLITNKDPLVLAKVTEIAQSERSAEVDRASEIEQRQVKEISKMLKMRYKMDSADIDTATTAIPSASAEGLLVAPVARRQIPADQQRSADAWALNRALATRAVRPNLQSAPPAGFTPSPAPAPQIAKQKIVMGMTP